MTKTFLLEPLPLTAVWKCRLTLTEAPSLRGLCFITLELQVLSGEPEQSHI